LSLTHLFNLYKKKKSEEFKENLSEIMTGLKNVVTECVQQGEGTVEEGKREVSFELYKKLME
jgi:hypothetical protein